MPFPPAFMRADSARRIRAMPPERRQSLLRGASPAFLRVYAALERGEAAPVERGDEEYFEFISSSRGVVYDTPRIDNVADTSALQRFASRMAETLPRSLDEIRDDTGVQESSAQVDTLEIQASVEPQPSADVFPYDEDNGFEFTPDTSDKENPISRVLDAQPTPVTDAMPSSRVVAFRPESFVALLRSSSSFEPPSSQTNEVAVPEPDREPTTAPSGGPPPPTAEAVARPPGEDSQRGKKKHRCAFEDCGAYLCKQKYCKHHGGMETAPRPRCRVPECEARAFSDGRCGKHGGGPRCRIEFCGKLVSSDHLCHAHLPCKIPGCSNRTRTKGLCREHGGGTVCSVPGCTTLAARRGVCAAHCKDQCAFPRCLRPSGETGLCTAHEGCKRCSLDGCNLFAQFGETCPRHTGKRKRS